MRLRNHVMPHRRVAGPASVAVVMAPGSWLHFMLSYFKTALLGRGGFQSNNSRNYGHAEYHLLQRRPWIWTQWALQPNARKLTIRRGCEDKDYSDKSVFKWTF